MKTRQNILAATVAAFALELWAGRTPAADFEKDIRPIIAEYCNKCHSTEKQKGDLDLEQFTSLAEVKRHPRIWDDVLEQLGNKEMPPKDKPQPSAEQKQQLRTWVEGTLNEIALASAGDPGPVILRRLSNAEYTYTIRDLTGVETLNPAKEFPVDGAAGEGFDNAGAALVMSPALLGKYLDAAKGIASHAVLQPDGIRFSPGTTARDWTDELLGAIRSFYAKYADSGGASSVVLQGIKLDTNGGGRLPVERYIAALLKERDGLRNGTAHLDEVARANSLSPKYLTLLWQALDDTRPSLVLDGIREAFRRAAPGEPAAVVQAIQPWQQYLWRFSSVGHIGKRNGPKGWQEPLVPLGESQELRLKIPAAPEGSETVTLYLSATDAGDGNEHDFVVWENPRLVAKGHPDKLLRDIPDALTASLVTKAPSVIEIRIPAALAKDTELVVTARLPVDIYPDASVYV